MGTVIIATWLFAVVVVVFALVLRFDPEARYPDTGARIIAANSPEQPTAIEKNILSEARENGGPK